MRAPSGGVTRRVFVAASIAAGLTSACSRTPAEAAAASAVRQEPPALDAPMPHGDHSPHHGGVVWMYKDTHFEVVLDAGGHHRIYFSDATRQDLPASVASSVALTIERPSFSPETVQGAIDGQGESWMVEGAPVTPAGVSVRVAFSMEGESYFIDMPFVATAAAPTQ